MKLSSESALVNLYFYKISPSRSRLKANKIDPKIIFKSVNCFSVANESVLSALSLRISNVENPIITNIDVIPVKEVKTYRPECQLMPYV